MKSRFLKMSVAMLLIVGMFAGNSWAKKSGKSHKSSNKSYEGKVEVIRDKAGNVKTVELKVSGVFKDTYNIVLDEKGKELEDTMAGKQVHIKGTVVKKAGEKWLTVKEYKEVSHKKVKKSAKK
ncbi:MAG: hypothetical protein ABSE89_02655 [Sedimentisphaerales bacterium]